MKCKLCGSTIPDGSLYCNICGRYQLKKPKDEIISPKPWQLPSGKWRVQKRSMGINVIADTPEAAKKEAEYRMRNWLIADERGAHEPKPEILTLEKALENYIKSRESTRAVTTISRYRSIAKFRFQPFMKTDVTDLDTQQMIDGEIEAGKAPKTIKNSWSLVASSLRYAKVQFEVPCLPRVPKAERKWLDYNQIELFLKAIRDSEYELGALLALHSLRRSELYGLRPSDYDEKKQIIHIRGALHKVNGVYIRTELNKNDTSARDVPIIVPRLAELLQNIDKTAEYIVQDSSDGFALYYGINQICRFADLPECGVHGLRHSFASLASHLHWQKMSTMTIGGWKSSKILDEIYTHNADLENDLETMREYYRE